jgi:hypothetical protein
LGLSRCCAGVIDHVFGFWRTGRAHGAAVDPGAEHGSEKHPVKSRIAAQASDFAGCGAGRGQAVICGHGPQNSIALLPFLAIFGRQCAKRYAGTKKPPGIDRMAFEMVPETGIEPATFALRVRCSTD